MNFLLKMEGVDKEKIEEKIREIVDDFSFEKERNKRACELSGGNLKKLNLACAFIDGKSFVILEQPTNALDKMSHETFFKFLQKKKLEGITIVIVSEDLQNLRQISDFVYSFDDRMIHEYKALDLLDFKIKKYNEKAQQIGSTIILHQDIPNDEKGEHEYNTFTDINRYLKIILENKK